MQTVVNLPDSLYKKSEALAASRGATVEESIVEAVVKERSRRTRFKCFPRRRWRSRIACYPVKAAGVGRPVPL